MMTKRNLIGASVLLGVLITAATSAHADSGIRRNVGLNTGAGIDIEVVGQIFVTQRANRAILVEVREPSSSTPTLRPDVVLDVSDAVTGRVLGHGKYAYRGEGRWENASVGLSATEDARTLMVIVRAAAGSIAQTGVPVSAMESSALTWHSLGNYDISPGPRVYPSSLRAATYVRTLEEIGGTNDTILMVLNDEGVPIAMDDNSGVDLMSFTVLLTTACERPGCSILPARRGHALPLLYGLSRPTPTAGTVTVIWDEGAFLHRDDMDFDGLGDDLELILGTCTDPSNPANDKDTDGDGIKDCMDSDVDNDGIPDSYEVLGRADESGKQNAIANLTKFPNYGADPLKQDLFVEVDWFWNCKDTKTGCTRHPDPSDPSLTDKDRFQFSDQTAHEYIQRFGTDLRVHVDIGRPWPILQRPANDGDGRYGNWGGAEILPDSTPEGFAKGGFKGGFSEARKGLFVHLVSKGGGGGRGWAGKWAKCNSGAKNCVHETGHVLGLNHWGEWSGDISGMANCKPNYISVMNYATNESSLIGGGGPNDLPAFSHGRYLGSSLNPSSMNESAGLSIGGTPDTNSQVLDVMKQVYRFQVNSTTGGMDWDQDGVIQPAGAPNVKAFINRYAAKSGAYTGGCDPDQTGLGGAALEDVSTMVRTAKGLKIFTFGSAPLMTFLNYCAGSADDVPCEDWYKGSYDFGFSGPSVENVRSATATERIIVVEDRQRRLQYVGRTASGKAVGGLVGGPSVAGPPTAIVGPDGRVRVYAPVTTGYGDTAVTTLRLWEYDAATDLWTTLGARQYLVGSTAPIEMVPGTGVGLTIGSRSDVAGPQLFAAIPSRNSSKGKNELLLAMLRQTHVTVVIGTWSVNIPKEEWEDLPSASDVWKERGELPAADVGRVGLAFLPADPAIWNDPNGGRFYVSWQTYKDDFSRAVALISFTRGNVYPLMAGTPELTPHGLYFTGDNVFSPNNGDDDDWPQGMVLSANRGRVVGLGGPRYRYFPNADGARDLQQSDHNDLAHIRRKLACAITGCSDLMD